MKLEMMMNQTHRLASDYPNLKGCLFIVTYGRSGSTLLQNLLMTIPGCTIRGENYNTFLPLFDAVQRARRTKTKWQKGGKAPFHPWYGADAVAPNKFAADLRDAFVRHVLNPPEDARWIGFKEIRYNGMGARMPDFLDFIRNDFPNAHIVMSSRDGTQVAKSGWWPNHDPDQVQAMVTHMDAMFEDYHSRHPRCTSLVNFADFSTDSLALKPVFDAIGEPIDAAEIQAVLANKLSH